MAVRSSVRDLMDELLKLTADAGVEVSAAETALDEDDPGTAREAIDRADALLQQLRDRWPSMSSAERALVGKAAGAVRERLDAARKRLPVRRALSEGTPVVDPEQDAGPDGETEAPGDAEGAPAPGAPPAAG